MLDLRSRTELDKYSSSTIDERIRGPAIRNPFIPQAKPHTVVRVVCPMSGGKEMAADSKTNQPLSKWLLCVLHTYDCSKRKPSIAGVGYSGSLIIEKLGNSTGSDHDNEGA